MKKTPTPFSASATAVLGVQAALSTHSALNEQRVPACGEVPQFLDPASGGGGGGGGCDLGAAGASCTADSDCCSNSCKGKPGSKTCK